MITPHPLGELLLHFRRNERIPDGWAQGLSAAGSLDEAAARAWETEADARTMAHLTAYFADPKALALAAVDLGRMLLRYLTKKKQQLPAKALDYVEKWATEPGTPEPKQGWVALADSVEPEDTDDLPGAAAASICTAITVPGYPVALRSLCNAVVDRRTEEMIKQEGGNARRSEQEVETIEARAEADVLPAMSDRIRARIAPPDGATLLEALKRMRDKELSVALQTNNTTALKGFRPA